MIHSGLIRFDIFYIKKTVWHLILISNCYRKRVESIENCVLLESSMTRDLNKNVCNIRCRAKQRKVSLSIFARIHSTSSHSFPSINMQRVVLKRSFTMHERLTKTAATGAFVHVTKDVGRVHHSHCLNTHFESDWLWTPAHRTEVKPNNEFSEIWCSVVVPRLK